jgi:hypothetical protein
MSGDVHVRFCESLGLQRPGPLTQQKKKRIACERQARKRYGAKKASVHKHKHKHKAKKAQRKGAHR